MSNEPNKFEKVLGGIALAGCVAVFLAFCLWLILLMFT